MEKRLEFIKMHGLGNDYIFVDCFNQTVSNPSALAVRLSERHFGIGSDGLVLMLPDQQVHARMRIFNSDGSEAEFCGNAIRCVAFYLAREKHIKGPIWIASLAGVLSSEVVMQRDGNGMVRVQMRRPKLELEQRDGGFNSFFEITIDEQPIRLFPVSVGNPHVVHFFDEEETFDIALTGNTVATHKMFPRGVNFEVAKILAPDRIQVKVWERGSGITLACGSGACAVFTAARAYFGVNEEVAIELPGGTLHIREIGNNMIEMAGLATEVFRGAIAIER